MSYFQRSDGWERGEIGEKKKNKKKKQIGESYLLGSCTIMKTDKKQASSALHRC
jgi:hypothetical protein